MTDPAEPAPPGEGILRVSSATTAVVAVTSVAGAAAPGLGGVVHAGVSGLLFVMGIVTMGWAFALGVERSRAELVDTAGLFLLLGPVAPAQIRRRLRTAVVLQTAAVVAAAAVHPFTNVAFGILAPMFGLGLMGLWGGRYGTFPHRTAARVARTTEGDGRECADG